MLPALYEKYQVSGIKYQIDAHFTFKLFLILETCYLILLSRWNIVKAWCQRHPRSRIRDACDRNLLFSSACLTTNNELKSETVKTEWYRDLLLSLRLTRARLARWFSICALPGSSPSPCAFSSPLHISFPAHRWKKLFIITTTSSSTDSHTASVHRTSPFSMWIVSVFRWESRSVATSSSSNCRRTQRRSSNASSDYPERRSRSREAPSRSRITSIQEVSISPKTTSRRKIQAAQPGLASHYPPIATL